MESPVEQSGRAPQQPKVSTVPGLAFSEVAGLCAQQRQLIDTGTWRPEVVLSLPHIQNSQRETVSSVCLVLV